MTYPVAACRCEDVMLGIEMIESYAIDWEPMAFLEVESFFISACFCLSHF